jgi:hypothetical protein
MPIFLERFVLPILAALVTGICLLNPWNGIGSNDFHCS